jgi:phage terminase small subunit
MGGIATVAGRGRKPKPTARKKAAGNPGKRAINNDEPDFGLVTNIDAPEWITGAARDMWERVAPPLLKQKVLQVTDLHNVEAFCMAYGNWRAAAATSPRTARSLPALPAAQSRTRRSPR